MSKRLLIVALCILSLPMLASLSSSQSPLASGPAMVVFAGHGHAGGEACNDCGCGSLCICDAGQTDPCNNRATSPSDDKPSGQGTPSSGVDYGTGAMILALV